MSIIRENQIREIRGETNRLQKIIYDREKSNITDYEENIVPVNILDEKIVDENKGKVDKFIRLVNALYSRLSLIDKSSSDFYETFSNTKSNEYRKYIELLNIVEALSQWNNLMNEYTNINTNSNTREKLILNLQKITPFINEICDYLYENIIQLCVVYLYKIGEIGDVEAHKYIYKVSANEHKSFENMQIVEGIEPEPLLKSHIVCLAFYRVVRHQLKTDNLNEIGKNEIAFEISQILNEMKVKFSSIRLEKLLLKQFKGTVIPELSPYFTAGFDGFSRRFNEIESMQGGESEEEEESDLDSDEEPFVPAHTRTIMERMRRGEQVDFPVERMRRGDQGVAPMEDVGDFLERRRREEEGEEKQQEPIGRRGKGKPKRKPVKQVKPQRVLINFNDKRNDPYYNSNSESESN
jgi:hypothetical protein